MRVSDSSFSLKYPPIWKEYATKSDKATARTPKPQSATFAALELQVIAEGSKISWIFIQTLDAARADIAAAASFF
jgi:hypothetical protein